MAKFPEEIYLPGPDEPTGVLSWGKSPEQAKIDQAAVVARIGGSRSPNYAQSYLLAANTLLRAAQQENRLDHHGMPIFFLQRHAVEFMIKEPLQLGIEVQRYRLKLGHLTFPGVPAHKKTESHDLQKLLTYLEETASALQVGSIPDVLRSAIEQILAVEQQPTWSRYSYRMEWSKGSGTRHEHLPVEIVIPLGEIQNSLQAANDALGAIWPSDGRLMGMLGSQLEHLWREAGQFD